MPSIPLRDLLINARQESFRMRHYYLGVEHLFVALLGVHSGMASGLLENYGLTPDYVVDAIRRHTGKGGRHRLWAGMPNSPRADVVLSIANDLALDAGRQEIDEADLLLAIFEERDSVPVRVLTRLGLDMDTLADQARSWGDGSSEAQPYIRVDFGPQFDPETTLSEEQLFILRRMFHGYQQIRIERRLTGGYSSAVVLVVTPRRMDNFEDSPVIVKIDRADDILDEARRYELNVKNTLPPLTARLEDKPTAPETSDLAELKYTFVTDGGFRPRDLRSVVTEWGTQALGTWLLHSLLPTFGKTWWLQHRPYRFQIASEYDWMLPPIATLEALEGEDVPERAVVLREPIKRAKLNQLEFGQIVVLENFTVEKVYHDRKTIRMTIGKGTPGTTQGFRIAVTGIDLTHTTFYRGELVDRVVGRVIRTRAEVLRLAAGDLEPDFDLRGEFIPGVGPIDKLPNPLVAFEDLLNRYANSTLSKIHGDLHLGNILVGPGQSPVLIDFAHTRDGHTLADWASLEVSLLAEVVSPAAGQEWSDARRIIATMIALNGRGAPDESDEIIVDSMVTVAAVRSIAEQCMLVKSAWLEYFVALAFCSLRALMWPTMSRGARRLMFLVSALSIYELRRRARLPGSPGSMETSPDVELTDSGM